jgi:hypothetical protein
MRWSGALARVRPVAAKALSCLALGAMVNCVDRLPDQDLRIQAATPVSKLSADILWKEYATDRSAADAAYHGEAVVVTGTVSNAGTAMTDRFVLFGQDKELGVRAQLLDEQADQILDRATKETRLTLKCFCQGLDSHVILKSCIVP